MWPYSSLDPPEVSKVDNASYFLHWMAYNRLQRSFPDVFCNQPNEVHWIGHRNWLKVLSQCYILFFCNFITTYRLPLLWVTSYFCPKLSSSALESIMSPIWAVNKPRTKRTNSGRYQNNGRQLDNMMVSTKGLASWYGCCHNRKYVQIFSGWCACI